MTVGNIKVTWCPPANCWIVDLLDVNNVPIVTGLPLITGASLLEQFDYLGLGGQLIAQTDNNIDAVPTFDNLGSLGHMYFLVP